MLRVAQPLDYPSAIWRPARAQRDRRGDPPLTAIILHSGDGSLQGDLDTLTTSRSVSAHFYVSRAGEVWQLVRSERCAFHAGKVRDRAWDNDHTIGIEQEHVDHRDDWPDRQVLEVACIVWHLRERYGHLPVWSHARIAAPPGRKIDPAGFPWLQLAEYVSRINAHARGTLISPPATNPEGGLPA